MQFTEDMGMGIIPNMYLEPVFLVLRVWLLLVWELQVTK